MVYDRATDAGKRVQTELGGKNPTLVCASADPAEASDVVASGDFGTTGQSSGPTTYPSGAANDSVQRQYY